MTDASLVPVPEAARSPVDVYKAGRPAARMWRLGEAVSFRYHDAYLASGGSPVAFTLPLSESTLTTPGMRVPPFFAGLLPEGESRRRAIQRAFHLAEDDELGLLAIVGADTVGDVQVVPVGEPLPPDDPNDPVPESWESVSFRAMWRELSGRAVRAALPGVQPKISAHSRVLHGGKAGPVILKLPIEGWRGMLVNERFFMRHAADVGLLVPNVEVVRDRDGEQALEVARFDRTVAPDGLVRHPQEDASQILGIRPAQKYDPDARTVASALASRCASPRLAARELFVQLLYRYAVGDNDVHAKNLSVRRDPDSGLWEVSPVYDVLHTWPYEGDHRFFPAVRADGPHDTVTRKHWLSFATDLRLLEGLAGRLVDRVARAVAALVPAASAELGLPERQARDLARRLGKRVRDLERG